MSFLVSLVFGIAVGVAYALSGVKSPAPPLVALFGLLGIVMGEQGVGWLTTRSTPPRAVAEPENQMDSAAPKCPTGSAQGPQDRRPSPPPETPR